MRILLTAIGAVVAIIGFGSYFSTGSAAPNPADLAQLLDRQPKCAHSLDELRRIGFLHDIVRSDDRSAVANVDKTGWDEETTNSRLAVAIALYCAMTPADGYFTVTVRNSAGEDVFRVRNGRVATWF
jgi:hypothetical protein